MGRFCRLRRLIRSLKVKKSTLCRCQFWVVVEDDSCGLSDSRLYDGRVPLFTGLGWGLQDRLGRRGIQAQIPCLLKEGSCRRPASRSLYIEFEEILHCLAQLGMETVRSNRPAHIPGDLGKL